MTGPLDGSLPSYLVARTVPIGAGEPTEGTRYVEGARVIDAQKVVEVALNPDDELRNLQVALLYSLSSTRLAKRMLHNLPEDAPGCSRTNANWFTVAQWAVLTVGRNMRTRDLPHRAAALPAFARRLLTPAVLNLRSADDRAVAAALSYGQVMVFCSVYAALLDSDFGDHQPLETVPREDDRDQGPRPDPAQVDGPSDQDELPPSDAGPAQSDLPPEAEPEPVTIDVHGLGEMIDAFVAGKREEEAAERATDTAQRAVVRDLAAQLGADLTGVEQANPDRAVFYDQVLRAIAERAGYVDELRRAFDCYHAAATWREDDPRTPADLIFEGTMRIMAVEQVILDRAVTRVIDHLPMHLVHQLQGRAATFAERSLRVPRRIAQATTRARTANLAGVAAEVWSRVMTDQVMVVALPTETIRLGRDIPSSDWRSPFYAPDLQRLSPSASALFDQYDRSLGDGRGAGAGDWRRFDDRMNFSVNLLRSRQQDSTLFWRPYTDEDVARVWSGAYPNRVADPFEQAVRTPPLTASLDTSDNNLDTMSCEERPEGPATVRPVAARPLGKGRRS
jgi:hypothetical protein